MAYAPVIVSTNHKGGTGKTTTSRVLAQALAALPKYNKGKPILTVDLDPQGNTSRRWKLMTPNNDGVSVPIPHPELDGQNSSVCDLWLNLLDQSKPNLAPEPYETTNPMIHVVPANEELMYEMIGIEKAKRPLMGRAMREWLRSADIYEKYSYVIIDTPPSKAALNEAALAAATHTYIPFIPEPQSVEGVYSIFSYLYAQQQQRSSNDPLVLLGFLPNLVQRTRLHNLHLKQLRDHTNFSQHLMKVQLNRRIGYAETDDSLCQPDQVTDMVGTQIEFEANRFAKYIAERVRETMPGGL
ncbi:MAG: ParA family protein [Halopseudomonas sabulinigri]